MTSLQGWVRSSLVEGAASRNTPITVAPDAEFYKAVSAEQIEEFSRRDNGLLIWGQRSSLTGAAYELSECLHRVLKPPQPLGRTELQAQPGLSTTVSLEVPVRNRWRL